MGYFNEKKYKNSFLPIIKRVWFSGRMAAYQAEDPDSISGIRIQVPLLHSGSALVL